MDVFDDLKDYFSENVDVDKELRGKTEFNIYSVGLYNEHFRHFREATGYGCDFRTLCKATLVFTEEFSYDI